LVATGSTTALLLVVGATAGSAEAQERYHRMGEPSLRSLVIETASPAVTLPYGRYHSPPGERVMSDDVSRSRDGAMLNGALIALGALGIFDNVVVHWILGWHRAIEDSPHYLEIEIAIVTVSTAMLVAGVVRERRARADRSNPAHR
jgi:hypothetical protein